MAEVVTTGLGEVERTADEATLHLRYTATARDRINAVNELTRRTAVVEPVLDRAGVTVRSRQLNVHDRWDGRRRAGAQANQDYQVLVTDVAVLDDLMGELVATEPADLTGPQWSLADRAKPFREAQQAAVADARDKAQGYAEALGWRLGTVLRLDDTSGGHVRHMPMSSMAYAPGGVAEVHVAELALEPQPVLVQASCTISWEVLI